MDIRPHEIDEAKLWRMETLDLSEIPQAIAESLKEIQAEIRAYSDYFAEMAIGVRRGSSQIRNASWELHEIARELLDSIWGLSSIDLVQFKNRWDKL